MSVSKTTIAALLRQKYVILGSVVVAGVLSMVGYRFVPKSYKVQTMIGVQTQYFQIPLVRDFLPETFDGAELRAQREALVRRALNHQFLSELGKKHKLFGAKVDDEISTYDLELLSKRVEIVPVGPSTFMVSFFAKDPELGYRVVKEIIAQIRSTLGNERRSTLMRIHDAIQDRLEALSFGSQSGSTSQLLANRPDLVKKQVDEIDEEIKVLRTQYSEQHPRIAELTKRRDELAKWLKPSSSAESAPKVRRSGTFSGAKVDSSNKELFQDLLKKYHYLEVVIYLDEQSQDSYLTILQEPFVPQAPVWPKRPIFLVWGIAIGFMVGSLVALSLEVLAGRIKRFELAA